MKPPSPKAAQRATLQRFLTQRPRASVSLLVLMSAGLIAGSTSALAQTTPRVPVNALPVQAKDWLQRGTGASYSVRGQAATVNVSGPASILHWTSMDVGKDASLTFNMDSSTARVLNKVDGGTWYNKTVIEGALQSNGQVYIYNPNGIIFGKTATVNVNSLVATTLKVDDQRFMDGLLSPSASPNFTIDAGLGYIPGAVVVEGAREGNTLQQAALTAQDNGFIMLVAPQVSNSGQLNAPDGQVMLAAGSKVYLAAPQNSSMRGLRVEVSSDGLAELAAATAQKSLDGAGDVARSASPSATNTADGQISVQRGNITMVGLAVNQMGLASATTSVSVNGSIILKAQDGASKASASASPTASHGGTLVLGAGSSTQILPTLDDTATAAAPPAGQEFKPSTVDLSGQSIVLQADAQVVAPSAKVTITARANPSAPDIEKNASHVEFGEGSLVDVSGSTGTTLSMDSNVITAELRGGELADNPLLKNSAVRGQTVRFDRRRASNGIAVANIKGYLNLVEHNVGEYTATGGTVTVTSEGDIVQKAGSTINVSGGWVDYASGYVNTSKLSLGNKLYDIETASASLAYDGVVNLANSNSNWEAGYREGYSAGTVQFNAPSIAIKGQLKGAVTLGERQRDLGSSSRPLGGQLLIGNVSDATMDATTGRTSFGALDQFGYTGNLTLGAAPTTESANTLNLDTQALAGAGFSRISAITTGDITVNAPVQLAAGGQLRLGAAGQLDWKGDVTLPGGSVTASALGGLQVQDGVSFNLAGQWQNDSLLANPPRDAAGRPTGTFTTKGGSLRLYGNQLSVGNNVSMDVSGGAWLDASNTLTAGDAGSITLQATTIAQSLDASLSLGQNLHLAGYSLNSTSLKTQPKGGSITLVGRNVVIGGDSSVAAATTAVGDLFLSPEFFSQGGFATQTVRANGNLTVTAGTAVDSLADNWVLSTDYTQRASASMGSVAAAQTVSLSGLLGSRAATSVTLSATGRSVPGDGLGQVNLERGATLHTDSSGSITLSGDQNVTVNGTLQAEGGTVSLLLLASPPDSTDNSYNNQRAIWLGSDARVLANGSADRVYVNAAGVASGEVLDGGTVRIGRLGSAGLEAGVGYVVAEQGSLIDVSGAKAENLRFKYGAYLTDARTIASAGGSIDIRAREGVVLAGQLRGAAGTDQARGGTLSVTLDREGRTGGEIFPQQARNLTITAAAPANALPAGLQAGKAITGLEGQGVVPTASFADGGFANLKFKSQDVLTLAGAQADGSGSLNLSASSSIELNAPNLRAAASSGAGTAVQITAPYVDLGSSDTRYQTPDAASTGSASLSVNATTIDLVGHSATQGLGQIELKAQEDIRLVGSPLEDSFGAPGAFDTGKALTLTAAQVYPTTLSSFTLNLTGEDSTLTFASNGKTAQPVLSAAGTLTAKAEHIEQNGRVVAPFGRITLQAGQDLTYENGSVTSVAGDTTVPLGTVVNGADWTYELNGQTVKWTVNPSSDATLNEAALPTKQIVSQAPRVVQKTGATLDASGGGSLLAYEFTPGPGGSADVLQSSGASSNKNFAININYRSSVAPLDWQYGSDGLKVGDQIYLSGGNGLPAGYYTLLPAHYALLSGGFAVEAASNTRDMVAQANRVNADGSMTIAGYRSSSTDGRGDTRWSGYTVSPQALVAQRSEFTLYDATSFFSAQAQSQGVSAPALPADAGRVVFDVTQRLVLDGVTDLQGAAATSSQSAGARGSVDITAPKLAVVNSTATDTGDYVAVQVDDLVAMNADSILLGGTRSTDSSGVTHIQVGSDMLRIDNSAAHPLTGSELILAAQDTVQLTGRAVVQASHNTDRKPSDLVLDGSGSAADGALVRLSGSQAVTITRSNPAGTHGRLEVGAGASLVAGQSLYLDATHSMAFDGQFKIGKGGALGVSAPSISLGSNVPGTTSGMVLGTSLLASLDQLADLSLSSYSTMDWYGNVNLGGSSNSQLQHIQLTAAGQRAFAGANVTVQADTVRLDGSSTSNRTGMATASTSALTVKADTLELGSGTIQAEGFAQVNLQAGQVLRAVGSDGVFATQGNLTLSAPLITTANAAGGSFQASEQLKLVAQNANSGTATNVGLGGNLGFSGGSVESNAQVLALAGQITVQGTHGVKLTGGSLDVHGQAVSFGSGAAYAPAGSITLDGGDGNVTLGNAAQLNLSAVGASAGSLTVRATGSSSSQAVLNGSILGGASAAADVNGGALPTQGSFSLDVAQAPSSSDFDALNAKLNSSGLTEARDIRVRHGDLSLGSGGVVQAHDIRMAVDDGNLTVAGTLNASGSKGGNVALYVAQADASGSDGKLTLTGSAKIQAQATTSATSAAGATGDGGQVILSVANADGSAASSTQGGPSIVAQAGSSIDVSGKGAGQGGTVVLRAPRVGSEAGSDVAVGEFKTQVSGQRAITLEGVKTYSASTISERADSATNLNASLNGKMAVDASNFARNQSGVQSRLGRSDVQLSAGAEVRSAGDLTVSVNEQALDASDRGWNLNTWRFNGQAGTLTLRAQGNLTIQGSISDGFVNNASAMPNWQLDSGTASWSYRMVGGADMGAANPLAVKNGSGDVALQFARAATSDDVPVALVRTGTGRIDVAAGRDVSLGTVTLRDPDGDTSLDQVFGSAIYTAGRASTLADGFKAPTNSNNPLYGSGSSSASFGTDGGGISLSAGRDVVGTATPQLVNNWLFRQGRSGVDSNGNLVFETVKESDGSLTTLGTAWWSRTDYFSQGLATFAGGDITVNAGRSVRDLSANVATNAYMTGTSPSSANLHEQGGGDLRVRAGGDILGGSYYVQKGQADLHADGSIGAGRQTALDVVASASSSDSVYTALRPVLAMGDAAFTLTAGQDLAIETVYNPTLTRQSTNNVDSGLNPNSAYLDFSNQSDSALSYKRSYEQYSSFSTYGDQSQVRMTAVGGDVLLSNNALLVAASGGSAQPLSDYGSNLAIYFGYAPATYNVAALTGSVTSAQGFSLAPAAQGQLSLLAGDSVNLRSNNILYPGIVMLDYDPTTISQPDQPSLPQTADLNLLRNNVVGLSAHTAGMLHSDDDTPVRVVAKTGDITGQADAVASLILPKQAEIIAGRDIRDLGFAIQHNRADDQTLVQAGRDIIDTTNVSNSSPVKHVVSGPGLLDLEAGRNIDLGNSQGVVTRGNLDNPYLSAGGASVLALAGATADYANFVQKSAADASQIDSAHSADLSARTSAYTQALEQGTLTETAFAQALQAIDSASNLSDSAKTAAINVEVQALANAFAAQVKTHGNSYLQTRKPLLNALFFTKTRLASLDLKQFDQVIASLFPTASIGGGDINVFGSQFKTEQGGSIDLLAPGGSVVAGLVNVPAYLQNKAASENGIFTVRGGAIRSLVKDDFLVNQGRVFTLGGGDITLISQRGNIDAGRGTKTASSAPPPLLTTDAAGNTAIDISGSISGSGIATLRTSDDQIASNVYAVAPRGIFDAGDAGVRSTGTVEIQASIVLNANNIAASSGVSGAVAVDSGALAASAAPSNTNSTQDATKQLAAAPKDLLGLTVELLGIGEGEDGDPNETEEERKKRAKAKGR